MANEKKEEKKEQKKVKIILDNREQLVKDLLNEYDCVGKTAACWRFCVV